MGPAAASGRAAVRETYQRHGRIDDSLVLLRRADSEQTVVPLHLYEWTVESQMGIVLATSRAVVVAVDVGVGKRGSVATVRAEMTQLLWQLPRRQGLD